jgi:hypothetical protein
MISLGDPSMCRQYITNLTRRTYLLLQGMKVQARASERSPDQMSGESMLTNVGPTKGRKVGAGAKSDRGLRKSQYSTVAKK